MSNINQRFEQVRFPYATVWQKYSVARSKFKDWVQQGFARYHIFSVSENCGRMSSDCANRSTSINTPLTSPRFRKGSGDQNL